MVRVGTLDQPDSLPPVSHIYTATKQPWVVLPSGAPSFPESYNPEQYWPAESLQRLRSHLTQAKSI